MTLYTGLPFAVEVLGNWGLDFAFIDTEHANFRLGGPDLERMILAAKIKGVSPLIRVPGILEHDIRKAYEMGADGVITPQIRTAAEMRQIVATSKFPPFGIRGGDGAVRSATWNGPKLDWPTYLRTSNENTLVIPTAENTDFFDNIDEILAVEGIDIVNFGPLDFAISAGVDIDPSFTGDTVLPALELLIKKCHARNIKVMSTCVPATGDHAERLVKMGVDLLIVGVDLALMNQGARYAREVIVNGLRLPA
ncbi:aldolase/citrate lyase family protein [Devosia sp. YIM 151766]|uniref:HpcH/HpaI aldolase family protein n=1 Tax=Devosia sp. YIM 151766 TaxID=3017325 RepID=UPI00255C5A18|nr:aldolase/citrate lyase family protein [Devosia sp. YIM 151766]WIY53907.1 aldolase/citrate lyase family protein [Devosia sp. YIM 151766]